MKKSIVLILTVLLILGLTLPAVAAESAAVGISADNVKAQPGDVVAVPVRITGNTGFTNFGISLDYDREHLTLTGIQLADGENPYLCGALAAANPAWTNENGASFGYVTCANPKAVTEDGILFTAVFRVSETFSGTAAVTPAVGYLRLCHGETSAFAEIRAQGQAGYVRTVVLAGDFNDDGIVSFAEAAETVRGYFGNEELTEEKLSVVDTDSDGIISAAEVTEVLRNYRQ